jgi:hypothetical protein
MYGTNWVTDQRYATEQHYSRGFYLCRNLIDFLHFVEPEGSLPNSQELFTCSYPEPDQLSPHHPIPPLQDPS